MQTELQSSRRELDLSRTREKESSEALRRNQQEVKTLRDQCDALISKISSLDTEKSELEHKLLSHKPASVSAQESTDVMKLKEELASLRVEMTKKSAEL